MFSKFKSLFTDAPKTAQVNSTANTTKENESGMYTSSSKPIAVENANTKSNALPISTAPPTPPPHYADSLSSGILSLSFDGSFSFGDIKRFGVTEEMVIGEELWKGNVQLNAGYPLLTRYERLWSFIHENNIDLCREAERTDRQLHTVITHANGQFKALKEFEREISALPALCDKLSKLTNLVDEINRRFSVVENLYAKLAEKKVCDNVQQWKKRITDEALLHEDHRKQELLKIEYKLRMEKERADRDQEIHNKLMELEIKRKKEFEERKKLEESKKISKAFDDAFNLDLHHYKTSQSVPQQTKAETSLEQLDLDLQEEKGELINFLEPAAKNNDNDDNDDEIIEEKTEEIKSIAIEDDRVKDLTYTDEEQKQLDVKVDVQVLPVTEEPQDDTEYKDLLALDVQNLTSSQLQDTPASDQVISDLLSQPLSQQPS